MSELLPIQRAGEPPHDRPVTVILSGLLAEGNLREHQAFDAAVPSDDVFGLIAAYGRDTAGALVFMPGDTSPDRVNSWASLPFPAYARLSSPGTTALSQTMAPSGACTRRTLRKPWDSTSQT